MNPSSSDLDIPYISSLAPKLDKISESLDKLADYITRPFPDKRIFEPDETCMPFYLSNLITHTVRNKQFSFRIPDKMRGVIAKVGYMTAAATAADPINPIPFFELKQAYRLRIVKEAVDDAGALLDVAKYIHGSVQRYDEAVTGTSDSGFPSCPWLQECRVILEPGSYWIQSVGNGRHLATFYGWTWIDQPKKP